MAQENEKNWDELAANVAEAKTIAAVNKIADENPEFTQSQVGIFAFITARRRLSGER
jgi:hypothetical protein